ncbi:oxidoreductase [Acrocarpospora corrugata]|uniref:Oxidoreductase n=1 Tax=Acrocarpospora corrugata TaxID=35763 RepID=A0A5M3WFT2_9ACTN|nr:NAD-dependent epimerase/dehydratase family protein [Acrocarpospora corrugata]GES05931.1 oxidoreductase [Acrocarpospora corrugata]
MRVVVTGASGFVGSHAVAALRAAGHEPILLVRSPEKARKVLVALGVADEFEICVADIRDAAAVRAGLARGEAVLHAAAEIGVTGPGGDLAGTNVGGLRNVLGQAAELGLDPIVHVSTTAVFVPPGGPVITTESALASPRNAYGKTKIVGERYARELQEQGHPVTIVYPGGVSGPCQPTVDAFNEGLVASMKQGWPMVPGGCALVDVRDVALVLTACMSPGQGPRRYMLGGHFLTWAQVADLCDEVTGLTGRRYKVPAGALMAAGALLDLIRKVWRIDYPLTRDAVEIMVTMVPTQDSSTLEGLGIRLRPGQETIADALRWLRDQGHIDAAKVGRLT